MNRISKILFGTAILALLLVACASTAEPTEEPAAPPPEDTAEPAAEPTEPEEVAEEMETILIGGIHPLTGGLAADGINMDRAIQMAIDEINAAGGVLGGAMLAYLSSDSTGAADVGQTEAERLINDGAQALICCFQSAVTSNVAAISEREGVPLVIDVAVMDSILDQGYKNTFRLQPNATSMGVNGANYLKDIAEAAGDSVESVVILFEGTTGFGDSVRAAFAAEAANLGIEVLDEISFEPFAVTDLTTEMTRINTLAPDVLVVTGYYNDGLLAARNAEEVGLDVKAVFGLAQGTYDQPQFVTDAGDLAQCFFDSNFHWDAGNPDALAVREAYAAKFGEPMRTGAVFSYQAVYLIADAIARAGSSDPMAIRDALADSDYSDYLLPYLGNIQFDETGENVNARPVLMQVQDGEVLQVWPPDLAEASPIFPCVSWGD
jgi:branched-chain amino acid transport system substrate-binding protein